MTTIEVEIPKGIEESFMAGRKRMSYNAFLKKAEEIEEAQWTDYKIDPSMSLMEFSDILKKQINGS